ncbi:MAG TPA: hypothetical protein DEV75_12655 [Desulfovibrio sp.]|jgi:hypothetical protein|nr:hypothetical protein [Desulfovibrio sp.]
MRIQRIEIENYRSIKKSSINFEDNFLILIGENESGKSNVLRACSCVGDKLCSPSDLRVACLDEKDVSDGSIKFVFQILEKDTVNIENLFVSSVGGSDRKFIKFGDDKLSIIEYAKFLCREVHVMVDVRTGERTISFSRYKGLDGVLGESFYAVSPSCPPGIMVKGLKLKDFMYVISGDILDGNVAEAVPFEAAIDMVHNSVAGYIQDNLPAVVFWGYSDAALLPAEIDCKSFFENPDICRPFKNMFIASGYKDSSDITNRFVALNGSRVNLRNMLRRVANGSTELMNKIWPDKNIAFEVNVDGRSIFCSIKDKYNSYDVSSRSDGFKRMVTFLLDVAALRGHTDFSKNFILMDEPDVGLHPAAIRMLRRELCALSEYAQIVISTHSTSMIDRGNMGRHIIVKRKDEVTTLDLPGKSGFFQEEVLYGALTDSVFSVLKKDNFIIEGWYDKRLFDIAMQKFVSEDFNFNKMNDVGVCYAGGCKNVKSITPIFQAAMRRCLVISDSDAAAVRIQREFASKKMYGKWFRYDELLPGSNYVTAEDFVEIAYFCLCVEKTFIKLGIDIDYNGDIFIAGDRLGKIKEILERNGASDELIKNTLTVLKDIIFENISWENVVPDYYIVFEKALVEIEK